MSDINIVFVKQYDNPNGTLTGRLEVVDNGWLSSEGRFLADLSDVHPDFAQHIVTAVNVYAAIKKVAATEAGKPLAVVLRQALSDGASS